MHVVFPTFHVMEYVDEGSPVALIGTVSLTPVGGPRIFSLDHSEHRSEVKGTSEFENLLLKTAKFTGVLNYRTAAYE